MIYSNKFKQSFLEPIKKYPNLKIISFFCDFETILVDNVHYVSCFSIAGPMVSIVKSLNATVYNNIKINSNMLVLKFIKLCFELRENIINSSNLKVYFFFHNFNKFDSFFIINSLSNDNDFRFELVTRNKTIYKMLIFYKETEFFLEFRDTFLLLNLSLQKIGHIFCNKFKKIVFDHNLNTLQIYKNESFNSIKKNLEFYCLIDSLVLKEGFEFFINKIKQILFVNPLLCLSLPSLGIKIFLKEFYNLEESPIENCTGNIETFIRKSYKGGVVDVFNPYMKNGYHYDINSLYPYVMKEFEYPVGKGTFMKGNTINLENFFGFLEVEVYCPENLNIPLLTKYDKIKGLICPVGTWKDIYFSEELKVAKFYGYKFKILRGVSYNKKKIFVDIIDKFYNLRCQYTKNSPINIILKLLMNSLYGRFGMKGSLPVTQIVNEQEYNKIQAIYEVLDQTVLNNKIIVVFIEKPVIEKLNLLRNSNLISEKEYFKLKNSSSKKPLFTPVQIASAITAYARIIIHKYKSDPNNKIYYSDTDSIFSKYPIHKRYLSDKKLGFMKECNKVKEAFFVAPKVYACIYNQKFDVKCKGVNKGLVTYNDIKALYNGETRFFTNSLMFKKDYKKYIISKVEQKLNITGKFLKRKKIFKNGKWVTTCPHVLK